MSIPWYPTPGLPSTPTESLQETLTADPIAGERSAAHGSLALF